MGSLTTNSSIHTLSEMLEDPEEEFLNNVLQENSDDASSSKKVMTKILQRLANSNINKQNNDAGFEINVTEENQKSPERSPKRTDEDNEEEDEILDESPAKRIKSDKPENETDQPETTEETLWNIERIVKSRKNPKNRKQLQYFIKWDDWEDKHNAWEPADFIRETVPALVKKFEQSESQNKNKKAAGSKNKTRAQQKKQVQKKKSALYKMSIGRISCGHLKNKQSKSENVMGKAELTMYLNSLGKQNLLRI